MADFKRMQQRGATEAEILSSGDVPLERELVVAYDTGAHWFGDGVNTPSNLPLQGPLVADDGGRVRTAGGALLPALDRDSNLPTGNVLAAFDGRYRDLSTVRLDDYFAASRQDGESDDTAALAAALRAAAGRTLVLGPYSLRITERLEINANGVTIDARGTTINLIDDGTATGVGIYAHDCEAFTLISGRTVQAAVSRSGLYGLLTLDNVDDVLLDAPTFVGGSSTAIFVVGGEVLSIRNARIRDSQADGIHISRGSTDVAITAPVIINTGDDGIGIVAVTDEPTSEATYDPVRRVAISDPIISGLTRYGGSVSIVGAIDVSLRGGILDGSPTGGVKISNDAPAGVPQAAKNITVAGTTVRNAQNGYQIGIAEDCELVGVQAISNRDSGVLTVGSTRLLVSGGKFRDNGGFGFYEASGTGNYVIGADLRGNGAGPWQVQSATPTCNINA